MAAQTYVVVAPTDAALPPPPGIVPDFQDPFSLRPYSNVAVSLGMIFSGTFLAARLYTKACIIKSFRWEDYMCILGFLFYCVWAAIIVKVVNAGGGTHQWNITSQDLSEQLRYTNYEDIIYSPSALFTKLSIILLVQRVFCPQARDPCYWTLQTLNAVNIVYYTIYLIIPIVSCSPRRKIWHMELPGKCMNIYVLYTSSATFNALSDMAMLFVPMWRIWHLNISRSRKLGISGIFFCGAIAIAASIFRLFYIIMLFHAVDYSYVKEQSVMWSHAELGFGIICSCLFVLPRLYRHLASIPPYGSDDYDEYQRKKSGTWVAHQSQSRGRKVSAKSPHLGGLDSDIERPPVPPKTWLGEETRSPTREYMRML